MNMFVMYQIVDSSEKRQSYLYNVSINRPNEFSLSDSVYDPLSQLMDDGCKRIVNYFVNY